ncbi:hypothetical protein CXF83_08770 [Shewanella sp. Choline-02u-19]|uniref:hypothetical protein n=1 Tax=unclassified Shewanella TaxID=196818 RepID=UPI000C336E4D|nr:MULTISPECIES: hypothetical protein [unclassified Shewanella]PKG58599.1 hypothetical protein CXF82_03680 [Shewanella sp. GutDb-MelDb]PKG74046.1 hypothetical protein CXF86_15275 [Shewanella sp. GutCb]PKH55760.1 hypothetical protein CXF84_16920 [Shewanella sp. Bg11-22]PKI26826.1 hypothetical protein CXF83_08770 [Shewanella sp. Choline-02u-19]
MDWLEKITKVMMLVVGCCGVLVIYLGFFYLMFSGKSTAIIPWYILLSPWVCIYFGLNKRIQFEIMQWFIKKFTRK